MTRKQKILSRYIKGTYSLNDYLKVKEWFRDDNAYKHIEKLISDDWDETDTIETLIEIPVTQMYEKVTTGIWPHEKEKSKHILFRNTFLRVAAALIIGVFIGVLATNDFSEKKPVYYTLRSPQGSVSEMTLPDGTIIFLNAGSQIKYTSEEKANVREVFLDGEAWFDVEKNEEKPFIVHTPFYNVQVLGTQFNVKAYKEEETVATTLEKGSVLVTSSNNFKLKEDIKLKPGGQLIYNKTKNIIQLKTVETRLFTSWKDNELIFIETTFGDLVKLLERRYGVKIAVTDKSILNDHYTGTLKNETILEILEIIKHTQPIRYKIEGQKIIIQKK